MNFKRSELKALIKEELRRQMTIQTLSERREAILSQLNEMYEGDTEFLAELGIDEGWMDKIKGAFKGGWDQQTAEHAFKEGIAPYMGRLVKKYGADAATLKAAIIKFMMENGGKPLFDQNAIWNPQTKTFDRPSSTTGGASSVTGGMSGSY